MGKEGRKNILEGASPNGFLAQQRLFLLGEIKNLWPRDPGKEASMTAAGHPLASGPRASVLKKSRQHLRLGYKLARLLPCRPMTPYENIQL